MPKSKCMNESSGNWIHGQWQEAKGKHYSSIDPGTGTLLWEGYESSKEDIAQAIQSSQEALKLWRGFPEKERIAIVLNFKEQLNNSKQSLAETISLETGKPFWESMTEVQAMIGKADISIKAIEERCPTKESALGTLKTIVTHKPHGLLAVFGPYNFPGHLPNGHIIPALLAGNTVLFKPSDLTPLVAQETMKLWELSGIPRGVINLLQGGKETGIALSHHPALDGLLFTGSWQTGSQLSKQYAALPGKILALEMGGNNPLVISSVQNKEAAAYLTILSAFISSGQRCTCARRLIVLNGKEGDCFIKVLMEMARKIRIGHFSERPEPFMGPLISKFAADALLRVQERLISEGAVPLLEMKPFGKLGTFLSPGLLDVTQVSERPDEEYFGPLLQLIRRDTIDEAIAEANRTEYGLSAALLSDDEREYQKFRERVNAGVINWNLQTTGASSAAPFGGIGKSGNHRPSAYYAADYCSYPVSSQECASLSIPEKLLPGIDNESAL